MSISLYQYIFFPLKSIFMKRSSYIRHHILSGLPVLHQAQNYIVRFVFNFGPTKLESYIFHQPRFSGYYSIIDNS